MSAIPPKADIVRCKCEMSAARLRRIAAFDGKVAACASATTAADLHHPIAAAAGGYRRGNGLAPAAHHVRAVQRRLHPHAPRTFLGLASNRNILRNGSRRSAMPHEARMIEAVAASHIVGVPLSERVERGTIGMAQAGAGGAEQQCKPKADDTKLHDTNLLFTEPYERNRQATHNNPNLLASYNVPAYIKVLIMQSIVALTNVCFGQKQTTRSPIAMSALPPKADIHWRSRHVRLGHKRTFRGIWVLSGRDRFNFRS